MFWFKFHVCRMFDMFGVRDCDVPNPDTLSAVAQPYELHELPMSEPVTKHANYNRCGMFGFEV